MRTYVNWNSIYHKFQQWIEQDIFINILKELNSGKSVLIEIDSTYCKVQFDKEIYKHRNTIERFFNKIKNNRQITMRFDKLLFLDYSDCYNQNQIKMSLPTVP
ncbi:MAG: transposase [Selenomonadaceae bacterium]|nr:transposase [Selenomonadaceae bacterium]